MIKAAHRNLEEAEYSFRGEFDLTCFLSQQSAELALKALLQHRGEERTLAIEAL
nr:HEPN domain-containing protein [Metallosphaera javensis (ex Hofmann et al. 2022)]